MPLAPPANHPAPMAKKKDTGWTPAWLRHRALLAGEVILVVGVIQELIQRQMNHLGLPPYGKVLWIMACTLGVFGVLLLVIQPVIKSSLAKTHDVVQAILLPLPLLLVHGVIYVGLFYLYAFVWEQVVWPLPGVH
ncbi:MAG TPA: hypothetical protein VHX44_04015 [Planctomycetota bacterium]|nr:hypothetical protein [Planctomycetota bacterium]